MSTQKQFVPPYFKNFGKSTKDLFKKKYDYDHITKLINKTKNGITLETSTNISDSFKGTLNGKYVNRDFGEVEVEVSTSQSAESKANLKLKKLADGVTATLGVSQKGTKKPVGSCEVEYSQEYVATQFNLKSDLESTTLDVSAALGYDGFSVGGSASLSKGGEVKESNVGAEYSMGDLTTTIYTEKNGKVLNSSFYQKLNSETQIGGNVQFSLSSDSNKVITMGVQHALDFDTNVKAKAEFPTGIISTSIEHKLTNPKLQLQISAEFNAKNLPLNAQKFGLGVTFGDF